METLEILAIVGIGAFIARYMGYLKGIPVAKKTAGLLAVLLIVGSAYYFNWGGLKDALQSARVGVSEEPQVTTGVTFEAEGSESDANLTYDGTTRTFTMSYVENTSADNIGGAVSPYNTIASCTGTITVYRTDLITSSDNATSKIWVTIPSYYGRAGTENESLVYRPISYGTDNGKYTFEFTPAGGTMRNEISYFTVGTGGSKAITFTAVLSKSGLVQLDNFDSVACTMHIYGLDDTFTLRFTKVGEVT